MFLKRLSLWGLAALLCIAAHAQPTRTELRAHPDLAAGNYANYPHPTSISATTAVMEPGT